MPKASLIRNVGQDYFPRRNFFLAQISFLSLSSSYDAWITEKMISRIHHLLFFYDLSRLTFEIS